MQSGWIIQRNQSGSLPKRYAECGRPHAFDHSSILLYYIIRNDEMYKVLYIGGGYLYFYTVYTTTCFLEIVYEHLALALS